MTTRRITDLLAASALTGTELVEVSQLSTTVKITASTLSALASDNSYNDSANGFVAAGFGIGDRVNVAGFTGDIVNNIFVGTVTALTAGKMTIGGTDGDVIVDDAAGESVTITKWLSNRTTMQHIIDAAVTGVGGALLVANNLSDLANAGTARGNLGLGTAAVVSLDIDGTLAANSDTAVPSQKAVKTYVTSKLVGMFDFRGSTDCSANPNYPAAVKGDAYVVTVAGKIGGAAGTVVGAGDVYVATADNAGGTQASVGASWDTVIHSASLSSALLAANNLSDVANAGTARTNLGATTVGGNLFTLANPGAITFLRVNADNSVSALNAATFRAAIGAGTGTGDLVSTNNLSDLSNVATARTNLGLGAAALLATAVAADVQAGTSATKAVTPSSLAGSASPQVLVDGAPTAWDMSLGYNAQWTLGGNHTLSTPTNPIKGQVYTLAAIQDGTGTRIATWPASFDWGTAGAPTLSTTPNKVDEITLHCTDAATPKFRAYLSGKGFAS